MIAALSIAMLAGCSQEPMFADIEKEVELIDPSVRGTVASLITIENNLYATNGRVYNRTGGTGNWNSMGLPAGAFRCSELASDGTWLYGRFTESDYSKFHSIQRYDPSSGSWSVVTGISNCILIGSGTGWIYGFTGEYAKASLQVTTGAGDLAFGSIIAENLNGPDINTTCGKYVATTTSVFSCDGSGLTDIVTASGTTLPDSVTAITGIKAITVVPSTGYLYAIDAGYIWRYDGSIWTRSGHSLGKPTALAWLGGDKNILLASNGTKGDETGGYIEMALTETGALGTETKRPGNSPVSSIDVSAQEQFESSLGEYALYNIFVVTNAVPAGDSYVIYASVIDATYDGLWAYYPVTRKEWNRE